MNDVDRTWVEILNGVEYLRLGNPGKANKKKVQKVLNESFHKMSLRRDRHDGTAMPVVTVEKTKTATQEFL